ncbi:Serine--tRNA ligase, mitochondrial [Elasticomyces elasticus]|uniref:serine--tRNA ligase n=1 Tax=Elasticomyces elasticus TaxID=574655 RepID=A0AAN7W0V5_9PEZI|nr:Serine--tRNA ligase, mitochondrial [Elasticomyces elasticus]
MPSPPPFVCSACRQSARILRSSNAFSKRRYTRPTFAPKPTLDLKHIRQNPGLYEQNCIDRNYAPYAENSWRILELHEQVVAQQREAVELRQRNNVLGKELKKLDGGDRRASMLEEAKALKGKLAEFEGREKLAQEEMEKLALELPNLSSLHTPVGTEPAVLGHINGNTAPKGKGNRSHVEIGRSLDLLDFEASATTSGWGFYFLKNEAALLEQALIQYALSVALKRGWKVMTPPSLVYSHIASATGFLPRDQNGETQIYSIGHESLVLAGTAEIPFAGSQANKTLPSHSLPLKVIGPSRCYRAEAGARGVDTKGLYRVHEFTKVEMFAWTSPPSPPSSSAVDIEGGFDTAEEEVGQQTSQAEDVFDEMISIQTEILAELGLHARVLEMPTTDLGASATRKVDIEAYFPSRTAIDEGYGEVTSASMCTDYQARRLNTKVKFESGGAKSGVAFAHTVNGTAMAIPRILAALLENGWDEVSGTVEVPGVLRKWMPGELGRIGGGRG